MEIEFKIIRVDHSALNVKLKHWDLIPAIVSRQTGITLEELAGKCKKQPIVDAKVLVIALLKKFCPYMSLAAIGRVVNLHYATIIYHSSNFADRMLIEKKYRREYIAIEDKVRRTVITN